MQNVRKITDKIYYIGADDRKTTLFENLFPIPNGVSYNAYFIDDKKIAIMDTVDFMVSRQYLDNIEYLLKGRQPDYLIVSHLEPDHSACIELLIEKYPSITIVASKKAVMMMPHFIKKSQEINYLIVPSEDNLELGQHTLQFMAAPMVHWPEVIMSYETTTKTLFSADAFGTFGALNGNMYSDDICFDKECISDARKYYTNIVGKFGVQVQNVLKKASQFDIHTIAPLHGPLWQKEIPYILDKYDTWSKYLPEDNDVCIIYGSIYGSTQEVVDILVNKLGEQGTKNIHVYDVSTTDVSLLVAEMFRCKTIVLAAPTYNMGLFPKMEDLLHDVQHLQLQNRTIGIIENGSWAPVAGKIMNEMVGKMKNMSILDTSITITTHIKEEQVDQLNQFVQEIIQSL